MGAEVVLPPALMRNSFGSYYSTFKDKNEVTWSPASADLLLDVKSIQEVWQAHGVAVHEVKTLYVILRNKTQILLNVCFGTIIGCSLSPTYCVYQGIP